MSVEEEEIALPADTLRVLNEFLQEKAAQEAVECQGSRSDILFAENWQLSQFWYDKSTRKILGAVVQQLLSTDSNNEIALLSCPSLYQTIKSLHDKVQLFEYDQRFSAYGEDFVHYDYKRGEEVDYLAEHHGRYKIIVADPPFLSEECISNMAAIIKRLQKSPNDTYIVFCSGVVVEKWLCPLLPLRKCKFQPQHDRNLGNEFATYANFDLDLYIENL